MEFINLKTQLATMRESIDTRINRVLQHGQFIMGPEVFELESELANFVGAKHCISCANGTDALQLALMSFAIGSGDTVFTTPFTFFATAEVISLSGATPYFVDIDPQTYNLCPIALSKAINDVKSNSSTRPRAVIAVDLFGLPANYPELEMLCKANDLLLIEDSAQGLGGAIGSKRAGNFGDIATTSFFPAKPLGCYGDGGALFTNNDDVADKLKSLRVHGKGLHKYQNVRIGLNSRLDTLQAAVLLEKLKHFPSELNHRQAVSHIYAELSEQYEIPFIPSGYYSSWAQYTIRVEAEQRDTMQAFLQENGIPSVIYYPTPLNEQPAFREHGWQKTPISKTYAKKVLSLPMSGYTDLKDAQRVVETLLGFINQN